jgi:hypothetical protein
LEIEFEGGGAEIVKFAELSNIGSVIQAHRRAVPKSQSYKQVLLQQL